MARKTTTAKKNAPAASGKVPAKKNAKASRILVAHPPSTSNTAASSQDQSGALSKSSQVDSHVPSGQLYEVFVDESGKVHSVYLMWSDMRNNHNKYYICQVLRDKQHDIFALWIRYGRVGAVADKTFACQGKESSIKMYNKKTREKLNKGYTEILMALGKTDEDGKAGGATTGSTKCDIKMSAAPNMPKSKLDSQVQELVKFIFDKDLMEQSVVKVGYDIKRLPLGELSKETVLKGYAILRDIEAVLEGKSKQDLSALSSQFYTNIPHNFGMMKMSNFVINTKEKLKEKLDLITNLVDIQVAHNIVKLSKTRSGAKGKDDAPKVNPIDTHFEQLKCKMRTLSEKDDAFKMIDTYVQNTSAGRRLKLIDCFEIEREGEAKIFNPNQLQNRKLLWHGSRFSNFVGILSQGMRIAPPEAPCTGYLFGKGVYFADLIGKSTPYCRPEISNGIATFVLCEVACGNQRKLQRPDCYAHNLPKGYDSTQALGRQQPIPSQSITIDKGEVTVPLGKLQDVKDGGMGANEFVVYNTNQIKMRYLVRMKVN